MSVHAREAGATGGSQGLATHWSRRQLLAGLVATTTLTLTPMVALANAESPEILEAEAVALLNEINAYRANHGLPPLQSSGRLAEAARSHSLDLARNSYVGHSSSNGEGAIERIKRHYPHDTWIGENVAGGFPDAAALVKAWSTSPGHNDNLLRAEFRVVGLGAVHHPSSRHRWYWTADFGGQPDE